MSDQLPLSTSAGRGLLPGFVAALLDPMALTVLRSDLDPALGVAATDRSARGLLDLTRLCLLKEHVDELAFWLPAEVLKVMAVTGRFDQAMAWAELAGSCHETLGAIAQALHERGDQDRAALVADRLVELVRSRQWLRDDLVLLLASAGRTTQAKRLGQVLLAEMEDSPASWDSCGDLAQKLARAGLRPQALRAARRTLELFTLERALTEDGGHISWSDLERLVEYLPGLLGDVARPEELEILIDEGASMEFEDKRPVVLSGLAAELFRQGHRERAIEVLADAQARLAETDPLMWAIEGSLAAVADASAVMEDPERLLLLTAFLRAHPAYPDGVTGSCLIDCAPGLLAVGLVELGREALNEGSDLFAADEFWLQILMPESLAKATRLMAGTGLAGALEDALRIARSIPLRDSEHMCWRKEALGVVAWRLLEAGRADEAIALADEALRVTWDYVSIIPEREFLQGAAEALASMGAGEEAARMARRALAAPVEEKDPLLAPLETAAILRLAGDEAGAAEAIGKALAEAESVRKRSPRTWDEGSRLARCSLLLSGLREQQDADRVAWEAFEVMRAPAEKHPTHADWPLLVDAFATAGDLLGLDAAITSARATAEAETNGARRNEEFQAWFAESLARKGDGTAFDAIAAEIGAIDWEHRRSGEIAIRLARGLLALGRTAQATDLLVEAVRLVRTEEHLWSWDLVLLAETLLSVGMRAEALELAERQGVDAQTRAGIALALARAGERDSALAALGRALVGAEREDYFFAVLGHTFQVLGTFGETAVIVGLVDAVMEVAHLTPVA